ncbi:hypothetical protein PIB30_014288 [Stylosanthes scabra]|uniref:Uncharacterized protein n=1 Tax=Stylosanthes scabra TaxID=79078 RepID=A0ABU6V8G0_9FABA|nr:hypothetical protein [Stylosanthes scabra]
MSYLDLCMYGSRGRRDFTKDGLSARQEGKASVQVVQAWDPVPWTTLVMGERQLCPAVVEPGEPGVLLDLPSSSFFSYEISSFLGDVSG